MKIYIVRAFAADQDSGNPAGVVLDADNLSDNEKKSIAARVGFSETAFVEKSKNADFKVRFFTPTEEVDLCGHATIATYALLLEKGLIAEGNYTQELKAGILEIQVHADGFIFMEQTQPIFLETIDVEVIKEICGGDLSFDDLKSQIVSTGLRDILLPIRNRKALFSLKPNLEKLAALNKQTNSIGLHAFTLDTINSDSVAHCRNFAPLYGIPEESATGSSNGALACYLFKKGLLEGKSLEMMRFEQGYSMENPSNIFVTLKVESQNIQKVFVGGRAVISNEQDI